MNKYKSIRNTFLKILNDYLMLSKRGKKLNTREIRNIINRIKEK